jgi:hypothetical protein
MRGELKRINDKFLDGFRSLDLKMTQVESQAKLSLKHTRHLASKMWLAWRQRKLFNCWKEATAASKLRKVKLRRLLVRQLLEVKRSKMHKWAGEVTHTQITKSRLKAMETTSHKALLISRSCSDKIEEIQSK